MENVNQPQGNGPQDHSPTQPQWFTQGDPSPQEYPPPGEQHPDGPWLAGPGPYQEQPYQQDPYQWEPGGPGPHAQQPGDPGPYPQQPSAPGPYAQQFGGPGPYPQQPGVPGPGTPQPGDPGPYAQQFGGPGWYAQQFGGQYPPTQQLPSPGVRPPRKKWRWIRARKVRWTAGIAAAVVLGAGGTAAGLALTGSTPPANGAQAVALNKAMGYTTGCSLSSVSKGAGSAAIKGDRASLRRCLRTQLHIITGMYGEIAYHTTSGTQTLAFERGSIVSATSGRLSVKAQDGTTWTWDESSSSIIRVSGKEVNITTLQTGTTVFIGGLVNGSSREARLIIVHGAKLGTGKNPGHSKKPGHSRKATNSASGSSGTAA